MDGFDDALKHFPGWDPTKLRAADELGDRVAAVLTVDQETDNIALLTKNAAGRWQFVGAGGSRWTPGWPDRLIRKAATDHIVALSRLKQDVLLDALDGQTLTHLIAISGIIATPVKGVRLVKAAGQKGQEFRNLSLKPESKFFVVVDEPPYALYPLDDAGNEISGRLSVS